MVNRLTVDTLIATNKPKNRRMLLHVLVKGKNLSNRIM